MDEKNNEDINEDIEDVSPVEKLDFKIDNLNKRLNNHETMLSQQVMITAQLWAGLEALIRTFMEMMDDEAKVEFEKSLNQLKKNINDEFNRVSQTAASMENNSG